MWRSSIRTGGTIGREWVTSDPAVMMAKPVIMGTRITVELILEKLALARPSPRSSTPIHG